MANQAPQVSSSAIPGMHSQPVITITMITSAVSAIFAAVTLAWPDVDPQWETAILAMIAALYPVVTAAWTWHRVYSPATIERVADQQYNAGKPPTEPQPPIPPPGDVAS